MMRFELKRIAYWGVIAVLSVMAVFSLYAGCLNGLRFIDFQWVPAKILAMGQNPYLFSLQGQKFEGCSVAANQLPSCLLLLLPFTIIERMTANSIWMVCNLFFTGIFFLYLYRLWFRERIAEFILIALLFLSGTPWRVLIGNGQHLMFSLAFFMGAYYYAEKKCNCLAGVLLALSAFKYTTIVPLGFIFLVRRWWLPLFVVFLLHGLATVFCGCYLHESPVVLVLQSLKVGGSLTAAGDADIASLVKYLGGKSLTVDFFAKIGYAFYLVLLISFTVKKNRDYLLCMALFSVIANVMFYHRIYDFVSLVFPLILMIRDWGRSSWVHFSVRWITVATVLWTFFMCRFIEARSVAFLLEHSLLAVLSVQWIMCYRDIQGPITKD